MLERCCCDLTIYFMKNYDWLVFLSSPPGSLRPSGATGTLQDRFGVEKSPSVKSHPPHYLFDCDMDGICTGS